MVRAGAGPAAREAVITTTAYGRAGVDTGAGEALVEAIRPLAGATARPGVVGRIGGFGGLFDPGAAGHGDSLLVAAADGVGTKIMLAADGRAWHGIGVDLVAMCVNDLVVQGAEPLFFLDYYASSRLDPETATRVLAGIAAGCQESGCALLGGETAEMPGLYRPGDFDLAGFAVGAVPKSRLLPREVADGDIVLGLAASGPHANGFSLIRKILRDNGLTPEDPVPFSGATGRLADSLLVPTRLYVKSCLAVAGQVRAFAHITGGGLSGNIPRVLPDGLAVHLDASRWRIPALFRWLARAGQIPAADMPAIFNCGIGMVAIVAPEHVAAVSRRLSAAGETVFRIGETKPRRESAVVLSGLTSQER